MSHGSQAYRPFWGCSPARDRRPGRRLVPWGNPTRCCSGTGRRCSWLTRSATAGPDTVLKRSGDGGLTWSDRLPVPDNFAGKHNAPTVHRVVDPSRSGAAGAVRLVSPRWCGRYQRTTGKPGRRWRRCSATRCAGRRATRGHAPPKSVFPVAGGARYLAIYHDHFGVGQHVVEIVQTASTDGGRTWSRPRVTSRHPELPWRQSLRAGDHTLPGRQPATLPVA